MVEASEDDAVVKEGVVERVGAGKLMAASPAFCSAEVSV